MSSLLQHYFYFASTSATMRFSAPCVVTGAAGWSVSAVLSRSPFWCAHRAQQFLRTPADAGRRPPIRTAVALTDGGRRLLRGNIIAAGFATKGAALCLLPEIAVPAVFRFVLYMSVHCFLLHSRPYRATKSTPSGSVREQVGVLCNSDCPCHFTASWHKKARLPIMYNKLRKLKRAKKKT